MGKTGRCLPASFSLVGKTAVITGGGGLLGLKHAEALAELGANVVLGDLNLQSAQKALQKVLSQFPSVQGIAIKLDVTDVNHILKVSETVSEKFGSVDVLVNNAAIDPKVNNDREVGNSSRLEFLSISDWKHQIDVGLTGAFLCTQTFGYDMARSGGGVILNIASDLSIIAPDQRIYENELLDKNEQAVKPVTYSVIKSGLVGLTKYTSTYWHSHGVRANALSPGGVFNGQDKEFVSRLTELIPLGRMAAIDEYKGAVQFLCSDASSYMTGQNIVIDGGRSVW